MRLTERDIQILRGLNQTELGKGFIDLLERKKVDIFANGDVTKENLDEANGRVKEIKDLIVLIKTAEALAAPKPGEFE